MPVPTMCDGVGVIGEAEFEHFRLFGFVVLHGLLTPHEVARLTAEVDGALADTYGDAYGRNTRVDMPVDGEDEVAAEGNFLPLMAARTPLSQSLVADDPRLSSFAAQVLGAFTIASPALATCLVADTPWHNDPGVGRRWLRFNAYLQKATAATGALRVVPGTHDGDMPQKVAAYLAGRRDSRTSSTSLPGVALETEPGDVVAFDPRAHHGAWGGGARLRWSVDYVGLPPENDTAAFDAVRGLIEELSSWPTPQKVGRSGVSGRPRRQRRERMPLPNSASWPAIGDGSR